MSVETPIEDDRDVELARSFLKDAIGFPYLEWGGHPAPCVPLVLCDSDLRPVGQTSALIDSGAGFSSLPLAMMPLLGIKREDCKPHGGLGVGGAFQALLHPTPVVVEVPVPEAPGDFYRYAIEARFVDSPGVVLGRLDFLSAFDLILIQRNQRFLLRPHPDIPRIQRSEHG